MIVINKVKNQILMILNQMMLNKMMLMKILINQMIMMIKITNN